MNTNRSGIFWITALSMVMAGAAQADIRLPKLINDGMVLQRDTPVHIWGWADPGEKVRIDFHGSTATVNANKQGEWSVSIGPFAAGGPYEMRISGKNEVELHDILLGDVWLASGQSNMEMPLKVGPEWQGGVINAEAEMAAAQFPQIRLFAVERATSLQPKQDVVSKGWRAATPETVASFSAVAYFFGRELHQRYRVPIGVIQSVWGGTSAEAWTSRRALASLTDFKPALQLLNDEAHDRYETYQRRKRIWYTQHSSEDRGRETWASPQLDDSIWPTIEAPRPREKWGKDFKGFSGVVWFRKAIEVPQEAAGRDLTLHLDWLARDDVTYFNGTQVVKAKAPRSPGTIPFPEISCARAAMSLR